MKKTLVVVASGAGLVALAVGLLPANAATRGPLQRSSTEAASDPVIAAVGDIACKNPPANNRKACQYDDVAALVERGDYDKFLPLGNIQYEKGAFKDYRENYDVYFGGLKPITEPVPGNRLRRPQCEGLLPLLRRAGSWPQWLLSYDLGAWHVIALNSAVCPAAVGCGPGDPQYEWLKADLAADDATCTLAYWHHPSLRLAEVSERRLDQ